MSRCLLSTATTVVALALTGCAQPSTTTPIADHAPAIAPRAAALTQELVGTWQVQLDPQTLAGTATLREFSRDAQQAELFNLSIANFVQPDTFRITGIRSTATTLDLDYVITHPIPNATNFDGPASGANRADLAVTGRAVLLAEGTDTFFGGATRLNATLLTNPDGFFTPEGLIPDPGLSANTFPYRLFVDEVADNRVGLSNGGSASGNYNPATGGWQRAELEAGATGYGILAQGSAAANTFSLSLAELGAGPVSLDVALLVKYEDPRGGATAIEKRANRLPMGGDVAKFAYRMPHGALDVSLVRYAGEIPGLVAGDLNSVSTLAIYVRDDDARATAAPAAPLSAVADPSLVWPGEAGLPTLTVDLPGILTSPLTITASDVVDDDTAWGGDAGLDSGEAGDELLYQKTLSNDAPSGQLAGTYLGLVQVEDILDTNPPADVATWRFNLTPDLMPLPSNREGATYQTLTVVVDAPTIGFSCVSPAPAQTAPEITQPFDLPNRLTPNVFDNPPHAEWPFLTFRSLDIAAFPDPAYNGFVIQGRSLTNSSDSEFWRITSAAPFTAEPITDWFAAPVQQMHQLEIDQENRILFATLGNQISLGTPSLINSGAQAGIRYFDYAGSVVTTPPATFSTGTNIPLAMALDPLGDVYIIDKTQRLRKYVKSASYAELDDFVWPIMLPLGPHVGSQGDATVRNIHDFVINWHNGAFFILAQSNAQPATSGQGNGYLYRIDCDGGFSGTTPTGQPNPMRFILNDGDFSDAASDITIDQTNASGALLPGFMDVQMVVVGNAGFNSPLPDARIVSSELRWDPAAVLDMQDTQFVDAYAPGRAQVNPLTGQLLLQPEQCDSCYHFYPPPPSWQ